MATGTDPRQRMKQMIEGCDMTRRKGAVTGVGNLNSIRRRVEELERRQKLLDLEPGFCPYKEIELQALTFLSDEELDVLLRVVTGLNQGRKLDQRNPSLLVRSDPGAFD